MLDNQRGYDLWAATYDQAPNSTVAIDDREFPKLWSDLRDAHVLELGCGTGRHTARLVAQGNTVVGVDLSGSMLARARARLSTYPAERYRLLQEDLSKLESFAHMIPGPFDAVVTALVLEHLADLAPIARAVCAWLKPSVGRWYISEIHPERALRGRLAHIKVPNGDQIEEVPLTSFAHPEGELERVIEQAGLRLVARHDATGDIAFGALHAGWDKYLGQRLTRMWVAARP